MHRPNAADRRSALADSRPDAPHHTPQAVCVRSVAVHGPSHPHRPPHTASLPTKPTIVPHQRLAPAAQHTARHCGTEQQCRNAAKWPDPARSQSAVHAILMPGKALSATARDRRFFRRTRSPVLGARMPETAFFTISYQYRFFRVFPCFSTQLTAFPAFFRAFPRSFSHVPAHLYRSVRLHSVLLPRSCRQLWHPASRRDLADDRPPAPMSRRGRAEAAQGPRRGRAGRSGGWHVGRSQSPCF